MKQNYLVTTNKKLTKATVVPKRKRAQEEMVGFGLIVIIVAVIIMIFLWFYISKKPATNLDNYEAQNYVKSILQYTSECNEYGKDKLDIRELIYLCYDQNKGCEQGNDCEILEITLDDILDKSWDVGEGKRVIGYVMNISVENRNIYSKSEGNLSTNSRGALVSYPEKGDNVIVVFSLYS